MFKSYDMISVKSLLSDDAQVLFPDGTCGPAEPCKYGGAWEDFKCAWEVFRGRARAVRWPTAKDTSHEQE